MRNDALGISLLSSFAVHVLVLLIGSVFIHNNSLRRQDFLPIGLVDVPQPEAPPKKLEALPEIKKPMPPPPNVEKPKETQTVAKTPVVKPEQAATIKEDPAKAIETKPAAPMKTEPSPSAPLGARIEGGGSEAGAGKLFGKGDIGVAPGSGTAGGGGGTAAFGLGRGSGAPGLPAQPILKTNREAKPIQTARASYPPMALRLGMESDVTLRIEVDSDGKVTRAEITKSGGAGFDDEALKAVKQSRFEPAQKDGHNIPAEFTYIYRFRLQR